MTDQDKQIQSQQAESVTEESIQEDTAVETVAEAEQKETGDSDTDKKKEKKKKTVGQEILSWVGLLLLAAAIALTFRALVAEPIRVDGRSMLETLHDGEIVLVTKPAVLLNRLNRGDVVIVRFPNRNKAMNLHLGAPLDLSFVQHELFVKRLVALPGDSVAILNGVLYVNDKAVEEDYIDHPPRMDYPRTVLGENQYMVMGDNRASSHDSRSSDVGPISRDMIVGKASLVLLPLNRIRTIH